MPKTKAKTKSLTLDRNTVVALVGLLLALLFVQSVAGNVLDRSHGISNAPNSFAAAFAVVAVGFSYFWEQRLRLVTAFTLGLLIAGYLIWQFGLH